MKQLLPLEAKRVANPEEKITDKKKQQILNHVLLHFDRSRFIEVLKELKRSLREKKQ
jgi:hypothetical protein